MRILKHDRDEPGRRCHNCRALVDPTVGSAWCEIVELGSERALVCENFVPLALQQVSDSLPGLRATEETAKELWARVRTELENTLTPAHASWLADTQGIELHGETLRVQVEDARACAWLTARLGPAVARSLELNGYPGLTVAFEVRSGPYPNGATGSNSPSTDDQAATPSATSECSVYQRQTTPAGAGATPNGSQALPRGIVPTVDAKRSSTGHDSDRFAWNFNPAYTFEQFVVGSGNRLAHAGALAVADGLGGAYNPLFLHGGVGVGKTHLLQAIGQRCSQAGRIAVYSTSETFTNELIAAIRDGKTGEFRQRYRHVDVLLVDDVHFIAGKEATQEEFFHTFNTLYDHGKQIVLSSDRPPADIKVLEERLRSRFAWGLLADIQPPDLETRIAILRAKAAMRDREVSDDVLEYLAERVTRNVRELEGAFHRLLALSDLNAIQPSLLLAAGLVSDGIERATVHSTDVLQAVSAYYRVPTSALAGRRRERAIALPRQVAMYLLREDVKLSLPQIGQILGGRDHSTVIYSCDKVSGEVKRRSRIRQDIESIRSLMYSGQTA